MEHDYIPIDIDSVPYVQQIDLDSGTYELTFSFNEINRRYYVDIADEDGNAIKVGEPICLNQTLWRNINNDKLPTESIVPMDEAGIETDVTPSNLGDTVQLCIDDYDSSDTGGDDGG